MVYSREHNSLAHRSMVGNYCKFIRAARFHPSLPTSLVPRVSGASIRRSPSSILARLLPCSEEVTATLSRRSARRSENPFSRS